MATAWVFPGQGSQVIGMARDSHEALPEVRELFARAETLSGIPIARLCFEGPADELQETARVQPCLLTACAALMLPLTNAGLRPDFVAGHSLGEYTALYAAGVLTFDDALRLVRRRGELMAGMRQGTMAALLGLDDGRVAELCARARPAGIVVVANINTSGQIVISGEPLAVEEVGRRAKEAGATRVVPLAVSGAFHSPLMEPAAADLALVIQQTSFSQPFAPIVANVDGAVTVDPNALKAKLVRQLYSPVRWAHCIQTLRDMGVATFWEIGPGKVLTGLLRQIDRSAQGVIIGSLNDAAQALSPV
jgi:[acyl-carrier-protein] S-malonyltransferase